MLTPSTPGVYRQIIQVQSNQLLTGVPAFLGYAQKGPLNTDVQLNLPSDFASTFGAPLGDSYLAYAVQGFFDNGGQVCHVLRLDDTLAPLVALNAALTALAKLDNIDLVCLPDIQHAATLVGGQSSNQQGTAINIATQLQAAVVDHCQKLGDRFAILDWPPGASPAQFTPPHGTNAAVYYPWISIAGAPGFIPPCGHVAGVYASTDRNNGVHKAPANVVLAGALDLADNLTDAQQGPLNQVGVNCLRAFPGRGIVIWGARTLSLDTAWTYINVRRMFLTAGRWIERNLTDVTLDPNDPRLWARITRDLTGYLTQLFRQGALRGATPAEAFYVKCDATTNPPEVRDAGRVVAEIGLAPARPNEFVIVRIIQSASGVTIAGPIPPG